MRQTATELDNEAQGLFSEAEIADLALKHGLLLRRASADGGYQVWSTRSRCVVGGSKYDLDLDAAASIVLTATGA